MRTPMYRLLALAATVLGLVVAAPSAHARLVSLHVDGQAEWQAPQPLPPGADIQLVRVRINGRPLFLASQTQRCSAEMYGHGVVIRFRACGRFRLTIATVGPRRVGIRYRIAGAATWHKQPEPPSREVLG